MMLDALAGLAVGDAFGETFFARAAARMEIGARQVVPGPWRWTDDTAMARSIVAELLAHGTVDPARLGARFASAYTTDPRRGYGGTAHEILAAIAAGGDPEAVAGAVFDGGGSMGNGAAMRVAPLGAHFSPDLDVVVREAVRSARPTHLHPDGIAGAVAVAVAAAVAAAGEGPGVVWAATLDLTPPGETRRGIEQALRFPAAATPEMVAAAVGNGQRVVAWDTVPFCIWCATRHLDDYEAALWATVAGLGDRDTTCAIVGGILGGRLGVDAIPAAWREATEPWAI